MTTTRRSTRSKENGRKSPQKASASKKKSSFSEDDEKLAKALGRKKKMKNTKATPRTTTATTTARTMTTTTTKPTTRPKEATKKTKTTKTTRTIKTTRTTRSTSGKNNNKPNMLVEAYVATEGDEASVDVVPVVLEKETGVRKKRKKEVEKRRPKLSEKNLEGAAQAKFGERLSHNVGFPHWPVPCDYGAVCQFHRYLGLKDVRYGVCDCQSCGIALCTRCFRFYHTEKYVTGKRKEKLRKKIEEAEEKFQKTRRYKGKRFSEFLLEQSKKA